MTGFHDFTLPIWKIFGGDLLLFVTIVFYIAWWTVTFHPHRIGKSAGAGFIVLALLAGAAAILTLFSGIESLYRAGQGDLVPYILLGAIAFYIIFLAVTRFAFRRPVTAELLLIIVWAALEISAIAVLQDSDRFSLGQALTLGTLVVLATVVGMFCYTLHYHLAELPRFWNGLLPLIVDAGVVIVFLAVLAFS